MKDRNKALSRCSHASGILHSALRVMQCALSLSVLLLFSCKKEAAPVQFETTQVATDTLRSSVTATGTIEPVTSVEVGTQVSGIVSHLYVDYNSIVKKGQVIAELDRTNLMSELSSSRANLSTAQSDLEYQEANYKRYKGLYEKGLVSANDFEQAELAWRKAKNTVATARENVKRAETNLGYATITSPIDGVVLSKSVEEGQTVAASFNTPTLFTIAQDLTDMRVIAAIDEADIGCVQEGQRTTFTVDAYPNDIFTGTVTQVRQEATTTSNVVTYEVVISAPNADLKLKPGLTANVTVYTLERTGVLSVRSKALRFTPTKEQLQPGMKIEDCNGRNKLWTREGNTLKAHPVTIGDTDGTRTEILKGMKPGTEVIVNMTVMRDEEEPAQAERSPFLPGPPDKNKKKK